MDKRLYNFYSNLQKIVVLQSEQGIRFSTPGAAGLTKTSVELIREFEVSNAVTAMRSLVNRFCKQFNETTGHYNLTDSQVEWLKTIESLEE